MTTPSVKKKTPRPELPDHYGKQEAKTFNLQEYTSSEFVRFLFPKIMLFLGQWLAAQTLSMIHGPRGLGKTYFALNIAHAVSTGTQYLGWMAAEAKVVLYLEGEMSAIALQSRLKKIIQSTGAHPRNNLRIVTPDLQKGFLPDLSTVEGQRMIDAAIADDVDVVIVDNLSCWSKSGREDAETWAPIAEWALRLRARRISVIFIHHSGKSGGQRGTSRREDLLDTVISLKPIPKSQPSDGAGFEVHYEKSRNITGTDVEPFQAKLLEDDDGKQFWERSPIGNQEDPMKIKAQEMFYDGVTQAEISKKLGVHKSTVSRWINNK